ncbi:MAG: T9SS type B sorting domain-containing protein [Winogradskyella sp.]|nr:T9SS type B sorting domain-containing protein [Winogradskyella sp.]
MLTVSTTQIPSSFIREFYQCDTGLDTNDGITTFDFSSIIPEIESLFPNNEEIVLSFYRSINDALLETNQILDITNYENIGSPNTQGIFVRVDSTINNTCLGLGEHISLNVVSIPQISTLPEEIFLCRGDSTELIADNLYDSYNWSSGQSTQSIIISEAGEYTVTATKTIDGITCSTSKTVNVIETEAATLLGFETVDWTQNQNIITVFVEGSGDYEFSIDGINYQDSNIFTNLQPKEFTVYIREKNGCGIVSGSTYLLSYPKFFTPNGDGKNDFWQIKNSNREPLNKISIYNRYGKLLATLRSNSIGWDGSYNGNKLPTSDYWFVLKRQDGRVYTSHFTLKR